MRGGPESFYLFDDVDRKLTLVRTWRQKTPTPGPPGRPLFHVNNLPPTMMECKSTPDSVLERRIAVLDQECKTRMQGKFEAACRTGDSDPFLFRSFLEASSSDAQTHAELDVLAGLVCALHAGQSSTSLLLIIETRSVGLLSQHIGTVLHACAFNAASVPLPGPFEALLLAALDDADAKDHRQAKRQKTSTLVFINPSHFAVNRNPSPLEELQLLLRRVLRAGNVWAATSMIHVIPASKLCIDGYHLRAFCYWIWTQRERLPCGHPMTGEQIGRPLFGRALAPWGRHKTEWLDDVILDARSQQLFVQRAPTDFLHWLIVTDRHSLLHLSKPNVRPPLVTLFELRTERAFRMSLYEHFQIPDTQLFAALEDERQLWLKYLDGEVFRPRGPVTIPLPLQHIMVGYVWGDATSDLLVDLVWT